MALYQDGILISGANTLPKMTLAEYNALPADQRPTYWERLDGDYEDVLAPKTDIATVESGTTASRAYSVGELVYVSGTLYRVKTAIASGATFTVGTNVETTNVSDAIDRKMPLPNYTNIITTLTTAGGSYTCLQDGWLIGSMTGASNGWAHIREAHQSNYLLAIDTSSGTGGTGVCIPFKKGNIIQLGGQGTYSLAFIGV